MAARRSTCRLPRPEQRYPASCDWCVRGPAGPGAATTRISRAAGTRTLLEPPRQKRASWLWAGGLAPVLEAGPGWPAAECPDRPSATGQHESVAARAPTRPPGGSNALVGTGPVRELWLPLSHL